MRLLPFAVCAVAGAIGAFGQVSVDEASTRAHLVEGKTTVSLALRNSSPKPLDARIELQWLAPDDKRLGFERRSAVVALGASSIEIRLPLSEDENPLLTRLRYDISSGVGNYGAFLPQKGILDFSHIADYAFAVGVVAADHLRPGKPFEFRVVTSHPVTGQPVSGVNVSSEEASATSDRNGVAVLRVEVDPDEIEPSFNISAQLGDFRQSAEIKQPPAVKGEIHIYTDKPLYQPGQTLHVRILASGGDRSVRSGVEHEIRIVDENDELAHAATITTSRFGIASTDWEIPPNAKSGEYKVEVRSDDFDYPFEKTVTIRRYELPSFRVNAKLDRPYYLLHEKAMAEIGGDYLFGKPVTSGSVRVTEEDDEDKVLFAGSLDASGRFRGAIETGDEIPDGSRFVDRHFTAFVTDASTNRTEQRKFDLRVSRDALHVYVVRSMHTGGGRRLYVSTYSPDGAPALTNVEVVSGTQVLGSGKTNRFGLARLDIPDGEDELEVHAVTVDGRRGREPADLFPDHPGLWLETERSLYGKGEAVECRVESHKTDLPVLLMAWNDSGQTVFSKNLRLKDGQAKVEIPYNKQFGRKLSLGVASEAGDATDARAVLFPGPDDLVVRAIPAKATYRPGETASIQFQASAETALGIAIVDQSVLERARTDSAFGRRRWFEFDSPQEMSVGGITERDLAALDPAKIDADLQLVGEVLIQAPTLINNAEIRGVEKMFEEAGAKALKRVQDALDNHYLQTLEYPRDEFTLSQIAGYALAGIEDPWMRPYYPRFTTERAQDVLCFMSAGPDKKLGTDDDFCALSVSRMWFAPVQALINGVLRKRTDYPGTEEDFIRLISDEGIRFEALHDRWGSAMRIKIAHIGNRRSIQILSAGPDRLFGTHDDFVVARFDGTYFATMGAKIGEALSATKEFPRTTEQLRAVLESAGIDFDSLRDPWGHAYYTAFRTEEEYTNRVHIYSYQEYEGVQQDKKQITPTKRSVLVAEIRSAGSDGLKATYDDFDVASFRRVVEEPELRDSEIEKPASAAVTVSDTGTIAGFISDASGAVVPGAQVTLNGVYKTRTDAKGWYAFKGISPGHYELKFEMAGFQASIVDRVPVKANHLTRADTVLQVGSVSETITVAASPLTVNTAMAAMQFVAPRAEAPLSTPRVREYFPETLYWQPELVTDASGRASVNVKLADSITTWHVAVIGSTLDGRITETGADVRAFQPFLVDLDVPPVLTTGDEIALPVPVRNYLDRAQNVSVTAAMPKSLTLLKAVQQPGAIASSSSANAVLSLRADGATSGARVRVTAIGGQASDAIEKPVAIHPDGERKEITVNGIADDGRLLRANIPSNAVGGSLQAEVKFYPSLLARVLESMESLLQRPYGCGEQTISSTYPNLMFLKALKDARIKDERLEAKAMKHLRAGYQRLLGYQSEEGGFTYWGHDEPDAALTAYALGFLKDAKEFIEIDDERVAKAQGWLARQDVKEGAAHALQMLALGHVDRQLDAMARQANEYDHPYAIAAFVLAAIDAGKTEAARHGIERLCAMAQDEEGAAYWSLKSNTPFYGWGRSGQVETTALVVSALAKWRKIGNSDADVTALIDRGALFLLRNSGHGGWSTTQSTVRALAALLDIWGGEGSQASAVEIFVNGVSAGKVAIPAARTVQGPVTLDISRFMRPGVTNEVSVARTDSHVLQVQLNATWYEPWSTARSSKELVLKTHYSAVAATINQPVTCEVVISRPAFQGYGMMIAEIGLPPGVEVDRGILANIVDDPKSGVDSFEVAPDHVTFYVWPRAADSRFHFVFRPRFAMKAHAAQSVLYDYYNPDERVVLAPALFTSFVP